MTISGINKQAYAGFHVLRALTSDQVKRNRTTFYPDAGCMAAFLHVFAFSFIYLFIFIKNLNLNNHKK